MKSTESCYKPGRRAFLKRVALAGTGLIAAPLVLPSRVFGAAAPSNRLNIAAIGTGGRCRALITEILRQGENLVAMCDVDQRQFAPMRKASRSTRWSSPSVRAGTRRFPCGP
ncbi:MAG: twin-arginine translocation signal domain-containing protein [Verrucomicrobia bacterium]|nr:twin-arginine translocation signal domain-containing protein [Verrucomicrobiota bacterium]